MRPAVVYSEEVRKGGALMDIHTVGQRFWSPRIVERYYDGGVWRSPLFWLLTVAFGVTGWDAARKVHGRDLIEVLVLVAAVWVHLLVQHRWFMSNDPVVLRRHASKSMLALATVFIVAVGVLLGLVK